MSTKKKKKTVRSSENTVINRNMSGVNIAITVLTILADIGIVYTMLNTTRFASLSKGSFILVNIIMLIMLMIMNATVMISIRNRKRTAYIAGIILMCIFLVIGSYGSLAVRKVNQNIDKITNTEATESVSTSLVVYSEDGTDQITDVAMLDGKTVGYAMGTKTAELGKTEIESQSVNVSYQEYQDYSSEFLGLLNGEIQCAIFPSNYEAIFTQEASLKQYLEHTVSILDFTDTVTVTNQANNGKDLTREPFTVLLIGNADGLSDTMILCSVNPISMRVTMSSIARDSYVPITCFGGNYNKINAANASSRECLINTIQQLVGVDIDYYVEVNFQGVVDIVDAIGGITVDSPLEFVGQTASTVRGTKTVWVPAGKDVPLNGEQALAFARERYAFAEGDFARQQHQQQVIRAMVTKILRTRDINTFLKILDAAGNNIKTNITIEQMTGFMKYALQKSNRLYDSDHVEMVFDIISSRVTGYSSGLWDAGMELVLYIYRLYQGSLRDTRQFITRNIDMNSEMSHKPVVEWSVNWDVQSPIISYTAYNEAIIPSDVPPEVLEKDAEEQGCAVNASWNGNTCECNGGYTGDGYTECRAADAEPEPSVAPTCAENAYYNEKKGACVCIDGYSSSDPANAACKADATAVPTTTPTSTPTQQPTQAPDVTCPDGNTYPAGTDCSLHPAPNVTCPDGGSYPAGTDCSLHPAPDVICPDGGSYPAGTDCSLHPAPDVICPDGGSYPAGTDCSLHPAPEPQPETPPEEGGDNNG